MPPLSEVKIAVIGLGYVGLPLAVAFGRAYPVIGFDIDTARIDALRAGKDSTQETDSAERAAATRLTYSTQIADLAVCNVYIVTVPTPIDIMKRPDLGPLLRASETVGQVISPGDTVIFESTVYPGATEEDCVPVIEAASGLRLNRDFFAGYSPERINPGDRTHRLADILKVVSGSTPAVAAFVEQLYASIITAGTYLAPSIRVAEAAKVIENTQRDVNIALINELALIFDRMGLDTTDVLEAAGTKWNFQPYRPGLVGGHCIGVDPYYLTYKAQSLGYHPEMVLAGRRINDGMGREIAGRLVRRMICDDLRVKGARVLVMGLTFKENVPDLRNTRVLDVVTELESYDITVDVHDPVAEAEEVTTQLGLTPISEPVKGRYDAIVLAVAHDAFRAGGLAALLPLFSGAPVIFDVKAVLPRDPRVLRL
ncbi:nucleotide sugar dehydrogenase [Roseobacter weihaiensis]|uniref:nucleotide sugar dehydrogenase n=1 Tax=Roseobacter weihaiensis TaxID=2763262 RepID=UPI001D0B9DA2|nr:nucleotide sugar dehydrogenase [Roseobacter sp. H9]